MPRSCSQKTRYVRAPMAGLEILSCRNPQSFAPHLHDGYVLWLNSEAGERFSVRQTSDILQPGSVSVIEPGVVHANSPCLPERRHLRSFYFTQQFLDELSAKMFDQKTAGILPTCVISNRRLWNNLARLHATLLASEDKFGLEVEIISTFADVFTSNGDMETAPLGRGEEKRIRLVTEFFRENIRRQFTLDEVASLVGCSSYHLIRLFRQTKGIPPHGYLKQLRLEHARILLAEGVAIADTAYQSGFSDQSHLTRLFKIRYGVTPGDYVECCCRR